MPFTEREKNEGWGDIMKFRFRHGLRCLCGNQEETVGSSSLLCSEKRSGPQRYNKAEGHQHKDSI